MFDHVRNWIEVADFLVNALTFLAVTGSLVAVSIYTCKTGQLVRAAQNQLTESNRQTSIAQEQLKASFKPALIFEFRQNAIAPGRLNLQDIRVKNLGVGTAFNVQIEQINLPPHNIQIDPIDFLEHAPNHNCREVSFLIDGGSSGYASQPVLFGNILQDARVTEIKASASYVDIKGNQYQTEVRLQLDKDAGKIKHFHTFK
jgi:hypothetical protein